MYGIFLHSGYFLLALKIVYISSDPAFICCLLPICKGRGEGMLSLACGHDLSKCNKILEKYYKDLNIVLFTMFTISSD